MSLKRLISAVLSLSMIASVLPSAFAKTTDESGGSYFDFEASEYEVNEKDGEIKISIVRRGSGNEEVDVAFKAADFLSEYGVDYDILDEHGEPLEKVYGVKPDVSEFVYQDDLYMPEAVGETLDEERSEVSDDSTEETAPEAEIALLSEADGTAESDIIEIDDNADIYADEETPENDNPKKRKSTGSPLRDAQAAYLKLPQNSKTEETESAVKETLTDLYSYFLSAEGAGGIVHFNGGETEKKITVRIFDNDKAEQNKVFMLALMSTNADNTTIAANATAYVTIVDDEEAETAYFDLESDGLVLTGDAPEGYVTVRRSGATQYFATVYVSTVKDTAKDGAYESFETKAVAFVPGETEKKVKVTAYDFSENAEFGIRLEGESGVEIGNYYTEVAISSGTDDAAEAALMSDSGDTAEEAAETDGDVSLMASNVQLGSASWQASFTNTSSDDIPGGWRAEVTGDGKAWREGNNLKIKNYDNGKYTMYVTNNKVDLVGVKNIRFSSYITNASLGPNTPLNKYTTRFETDCDQTFEGCLNGYSIDGNRGWKEETLNIDRSGDSAYLKFSVKVRAAGLDNPQAQLDWIRLNHAYYTFSCQNSAENFTRNIYDFTQGTPNVYSTYWRDETTKIYNPGGITIKRANGDTVAGFYGGVNEKIYITAANESKNKGKGIYLSGVIFAKDNTKSKYYKVNASGGTVSVTLDSNFIKTLRDNGVISGVHTDATVKVFPVFAQEEVTVAFENADREDYKAEKAGKYDENNKASHITNVLEAYKAETKIYNNKKMSKKQAAGWLDYYEMSVPVDSVIRVGVQPESTRVASGVAYRYGSDSEQIAYYEEGKTKFSGDSSKGEMIDKTDYSKADIVASENVTIRPVTGKQNFEIKYFPGQDVPEVYKEKYKGLSGAVVRSDALDINNVSGHKIYRIKNLNSGKYLIENKESKGNLKYSVYQGDIEDVEEKRYGEWIIMPYPSGEGDGYYHIGGYVGEL
ncbi:MAG: hypothetical protein J1F64_09170, partial [Oscillospiraceae bacterium]|nr:hypothetical protein [Oscillospiraceae bacterium]